MDLIIPDWPAPANVSAFTTLRTGGFSKPPYGDADGGLGLNLGTHVGDDPETVRKNRALLRASLPSDPVWLNQVHGAEVVEADKVSGVPDADAAWTAVAGKVCIIMTADCLPVLFCSADGKVVGAAHGGWRGLAAGVLQRTVEAMRTRSNAPIIAWLGPAIGSKVFEVGGEVRAAFVGQDSAMASSFAPENGVPGKFIADIYGIARTILKHMGITSVYGGDWCTVTDAARFYSFRRDHGKTGRMATGIWLSGGDVDG
ncbi:MAG: peptidoglycan editing factor PgeF [Oxalobacter sp.]|nr:peptidoglycan editing factor PgeF [Oxalobacter sp.]